MGVSKLPSFGTMTPLESIIKGGSAKDVLSPNNALKDWMGIIQKPRTILNAKAISGQADPDGKSLVTKNKEAKQSGDAQAIRDFQGMYGNAEGFANGKKLTVGLKV